MIKLTKKSADPGGAALSVVFIDCALCKYVSYDVLES